MAINVQYNPSFGDYGEALVAASRNIEDNRRALDVGKLQMALKAQSDALRSQVVQRGVAGGGGAQITSSDPSGIGNLGSNLSSASSFQLQQAPAPRQRYGTTYASSNTSAGTGYTRPGDTSTGQMIYNPTNIMNQAGQIGNQYLQAYEPLKQALFDPLKSAYQTFMGAFQ